MRAPFLNLNEMEEDNRSFILSVLHNSNSLKKIIKADKNYTIHDFESDFQVQSNIIFSAGMKCRYYTDILSNKTGYNKPFLIPILSSNAFDDNEPIDFFKNEFEINLNFLKGNRNLYRCGVLFLPPETMIIKTQGSFNPYLFLYNFSSSDIFTECTGTDSQTIKENNYCIVDYNSKVFKLQNLSKELSISFVSLLKTSANPKPDFLTFSIDTTD